jgi:hypothetical protein
MNFRLSSRGRRSASPPTSGQEWRASCSLGSVSPYAASGPGGAKGVAELDGSEGFVPRAALGAEFWARQPIRCMRSEHRFTAPPITAVPSEKMVSFLTPVVVQDEKDGFAKAAGLGLAGQKPSGAGRQLAPPKWPRSPSALSAPPTSGAGGPVWGSTDCRVAAALPAGRRPACARRGGFGRQSLAGRAAGPGQTGRPAVPARAERNLH